MHFSFASIGHCYYYFFIIIIIMIAVAVIVVVLTGVFCSKLVADRRTPGHLKATARCCDILWQAVR
jgi:uncharacterized membrane protein